MNVIIDFHGRWRGHKWPKLRPRPRAWGNSPSNASIHVFVPLFQNFCMVVLAFTASYNIRTYLSTYLHSVRFVVQEIKQVEFEQQSQNAKTTFVKTTDGGLGTICLWREEYVKHKWRSNRWRKSIKWKGQTGMFEMRWPWKRREWSWWNESNERCQHV